MENLGISRYAVGTRRRQWKAFYDLVDRCDQQIFKRLTAVGVLEGKLVHKLLHHTAHTHTAFATVEWHAGERYRLCVRT